MPYRLIVTDLMNRTAPLTAPQYEPTPKEGQYLAWAKATVTKVEKGDPVNDVYAQAR